MLISHAEFEVFYPLLRAKFFETELKSKLPKGARGIDSPLVWDEKYISGDHRGQFISTVLFQGGTTNDPRQFYRKWSEFQSKLKAVIDDLAFNKALKYIGVIPVGDTINTDYKSLKLELTARYNEFCQAHRVEIDSIAARGLNPSLKKPSILIETNKIIPPEMLNEDFEKVKVLVYNFYDDISIKSLEHAWERLSPNFKDRSWKNSYDRFEEGYFNTRGIREVEVTDIRLTSTFNIDCTVSYQDEIEVYSSFELAALHNMTVGDVDEFIRIIKKLRADVEKSGGVGFDKIELSKFFNPASSEYIWFHCGFHPDELDNLFRNKKTVFIERNYTFTCHKLDEHWYIDRIRHFQTHSSR